MAAYNTKAIFGVTAALVFTSCTMPVMAAPVYNNGNVKVSVVSTDSSYVGGLDLAAQIITTVEQDQRSAYAKKGIAVADNYVEIRTVPDETAEIIGKLYTGSGCEIKEVSDGWTHIVSGECDGYVKSRYLITGVDAQDYAMEHSVSKIIAKTQGAQGFLYETFSTTASIVSTVSSENEMTVLSTTEDGVWVQVQFGDKTGYVPADAVVIDVKYEAAVPVQAAVETEAPQTEAPVETEAPQTEAPAETEAPQTEAPAETEAPQTEAPVETEAPQTEAPAETEAPQTEAPAETEAPQTEAPAETEAPQTEAPAETEAPQTETPAITEVNETVWAAYSVSIREKASAESERVGILVGSYDIVRTGLTDNGWSRVDYNGTEAYIKSEYLMTTKPAAATEREAADNTEVQETKAPETEAETKAPETEAPAAPAIEEVNETVYATTGVNVRSDASTNASIIGGLSNGASVKRTGKTGDGWSRVEYYGATAYVKSDYLTTQQPVVETKAPETVAETKAPETEAPAAPAIEEVNETVYATTGVNVRSDASTSASRVGALATGGSVKRTGKTSNGWSRVEFNGQTAYISSDYLTTEAPVVETEAPAVQTSSSTSDSALGQQIVDFALQYVGYPYVYGGNDLNTGVDCSGFTQQVYLNFGYSIPRRASIQATAGTDVSISNLQPGDLVFYGDGYSEGVGHVVIYIGNDQVVHASTPTKGIIISNLYYRTPLCAKRII